MKQPCWYCGKLANNGCEPKHPDRLTRDHVFPRVKILPRGSIGVEALGGSMNTVDACYACNLEKGTLTLDQYRLLKLGSADALFVGETRTIGRPDINGGINFKTLEHQRWIVAIAAMQEAICS